MRNFTNLPPLVESVWSSSIRPKDYREGAGNVGKRLTRARILMFSILGPQAHTAVVALRNAVGALELAGTQAIKHLQSFGPTYQADALEYGGLNRPKNIPAGAYNWVDMPCPSWPAVDPVKENRDSWTRRLALRQGHPNF